MHDLTDKGYKNYLKGIPVKLAKIHAITLLSTHNQCTSRASHE
jgi:hypothetical protein